MAHKTSKNYTATWSEQDEAALLELLRHQMGALREEMRSAHSPYTNRQLRNRKNQCAALIKKIESGRYNPKTIRNGVLSGEDSVDWRNRYLSAQIGKSKFVDSYKEIDFDYDRYFAKTRYYGTSLPILTIVLSLVFIFIMLASALIPTAYQTLIDSYMPAIGNTAEYPNRLTIGSIAYYKLSATSEHFKIPNDGNWPTGIYQDPGNAPVMGVQWTSSDGNIPATVDLYDDLGMIAIDITTIDVVRSLFRTPMLSKQKIDAIENLDAIQGRSWYYRCFMFEKDLSIEKNENGEYDGAAIIRHIATYGTIIFFVAALICAFLQVIFGIGQLFSYSSRRIHATAILTLIFAALALFCPMFLEIQELSGASVQAAFGSYFTMDWLDFTSSPKATTAFNFFMLIPLILPLITTLLPLFFKNRTAKAVTFVPKGNRKHTYTGQKAPVRAGKDRVTTTNRNGTPLPRASLPPYSPNTPYRRP